MLAPANEIRLDAVESLNVHNKGKNGQSVGAYAVARSSQSSMAESRQD